MHLNSKIFQALEFTINFVLLGNPLIFPFVNKQLIAILLLQALLAIPVKCIFYYVQAIIVEYKIGRINEHNAVQEDETKKLGYPHLHSKIEITSGLKSAILSSFVAAIIKNLAREVKYLFNILSHTSNTLSLFLFTSAIIALLEFNNKLVKILETSFDGLTGFENSNEANTESNNSSNSNEKKEQTIYEKIKNKLHEILWKKLRGTLTLTLGIVLTVVCLVKALTFIKLLDNLNLYIEVGEHVINILNNKNYLLVIIFVEYLIFYAMNEFFETIEVQNDKTTKTIETQNERKPKTKTGFNQIISYIGLEVKKSKTGTLKRFLYIFISTIPFAIGLIMSINATENLRCIEIYNTVPVLINLGLFIVSTILITFSFQSMQIKKAFDEVECKIREKNIEFDSSESLQRNAGQLSTAIVN